MTDYDKLVEVLGIKTIENIKCAEEVAEQFLQCGKCRNILRSRTATTKVVAAAIYSLSRYLPVKIKGEKDAGKRKNKNMPINLLCRSKVGDIPHLIVFLSTPIVQLFHFLERDKELAAYLKDVKPQLNEGYDDALKEMYTQLTATMKRMVIDNQLQFFSSVDYSFRVHVGLANPLMDEYPIEVFAYDTCTTYELLSRIQNDITQVLTEHHVTNTLSLEELGIRFRDARIRIGLTQKELAERIGINTLTVTRMEAGNSISAPILMQFLCYFSQFISIDVLFDRNMWSFAQQNPDFMIKKIHLTSVLNRKMVLMKKNILKQLSDLQTEMVGKVGESFRYCESNLNSAINLTEEM